MTDPESARTPRQSSRPVRAATAALRVCASLKLAVVVLTLYIAVLAWATIFMSRWYGDDELKYGIYHSGWFLLLNAILALNVLAATVVRFPWRPRQTGFVITHLGILVLLAGSWLSYHSGVDATMAVYEHMATSRAFQRQNHFELRVAKSADDLANAEPIIVPFRAGPFNWQDYGTKHAWFPWGVAGHASGVLLDHDGVRLEVLDYYHDSTRLPLPRLDLIASYPDASKSRSLRGDSRSIRLAVTSSPSRHGQRPSGMGSREVLDRGQRINFWMTQDPREREAFSRSQPEGELGKLGQLVVWHDGQVYRWAVNEMKVGERRALGESGVEVELSAINPPVMGLTVPAVHLMIYDGKEASPPERMVLYAALPHWNHQGHRNGVFGTYWLCPNRGEADSPDAARLDQDARAPRVDVLQGEDQKLYYRLWRVPEIGTVPVRGEVTIAPWPADEPQIVAFAGTADELRLERQAHVARPKPDWEVVPVPYQRDADEARQPRARVRLTVDGTSEEFWLAGPGPRTTSDQEHRMAAGGRQVAIAMPQDFVALGFEVYLHEFQRKLDPGARRASYYASRVDFREPGQTDQGPSSGLPQDVVITLNHPIDVLDPKSDRTYRFFQSSFSPPEKPGDPFYDRLVKPDDPRARLYRSIFQVNCDPGRSLKYLGSLLIIVGITIYYFVRFRAPKPRV